jgi:hypothetical protein
MLVKSTIGSFTNIALDSDLTHLDRVRKNNFCIFVLNIRLMCAI